MSYGRLRHVKYFYFAYKLLETALILVPFWSLAAIPRAWRPQKSWTWARTMHANLVRHFYVLSNDVGGILISPSSRALISTLGFGYGLWVDAAPMELVTANLKFWASTASVSPVKLPGYWRHEPKTSIQLESPLMPGEKIVYALHGGAYTLLSAHPWDITSSVQRGLLKRVHSVHRTFSIEYRLSSTKPLAVANPFPTALLDALTGYNYLVNTLQIPPADIIIEGHSAGGNLALALVRYLVESSALPLPGALLLLSPWCDLGTSHIYPGSSMRTCVKTDYIVPNDSLGYSVHAFTGPFGVGAAEFNPYISPASMHLTTPISFAGFPRTFITAGGGEILRDSIRTLHRRMAADIGEDRVRYFEPHGLPHDFMVFEGGFYDPERRDAFNAIAEWVES